MCMRILDRRVHLLLDEARYGKVAREAARQGVSVASVIRDAIDRLPDDIDERRAAIEEILAAAPMPVPGDPRDIRREVNAARDRMR